MTVSLWLEKTLLLTHTREAIHLIQRGAQGSGSVHDSTGNVAGFRSAVNVNGKERTVQVVCWDNQQPLLFIKEKLEKEGWTIEPPGLINERPSWSISITVP